MQHPELRLPEKINQRVRNKEEKIIAGSSETQEANSARTHIEAIDRSGEISQPNIAALIETMDNESEEICFEDDNEPGDTAEPYKDDVSTTEKTHVEAVGSLEKVKSTSQTALESLGDKQERLYHKAADKLGKAADSMKEAKGNVQTFVDKLFSAVEND